ncbi:Fic family protein [Pedobacter glucosidilyticus]|uniref:Fic family protein n=1 Tax=Pedobacter glucosidilyticus TaxID=1122941 RepID=UPI0003FC5644|nr:RNA-binding domain-containing protein [Pedobacter glucosidilyticus]
MITKIQLRELLLNLESDRVERTVSTNNTQKFAIAICAFANDFSNHQQPGYLLIGVDDNGQLSGLNVTDDLLKNLGGLRSDGLILPQPQISICHFNFAEGDVVVVEVLPSSFPPLRYKGQVWIRVGPGKAVANEAEERILIEKRVSSATTFDTRPCLGASLADLNLDIFTQYYLPKAIDAESLKNDHRDIREQLASLRFFDVRYNCPTHAGVILFGKSPEFFLFGAYVQYVSFKGLTLGSEINNELKFSGDLFSILLKLDTFIETSLIKRHPVPVTVLREEIVKNYSFWAIRELMMNAIMHRDYESNTPIRFYEYSNRIELMNPGNLYGNARPENFPNVNDYRNPVIAEALKILGYVNRFSRGVARVKEELLENGNGVAEFDFSKVTVFEVKVPISSHYLAFTDPVTDPFTDPVIQLLKLLAQGELSSSEMRARLGIKHRANYIHPAISLGLIVQTIPEKPNSRLQKYKLTERARKYLSENVIKN